MFEKLRQRWKVNSLNLFLIICNFALGGSACAWLGRKILATLSIERGGFGVILYIILITVLWPICVIVISVPLGQYSFFKNYLQRVGKRIAGKKD